MCELVSFLVMVTPIWGSQLKDYKFSCYVYGLYVLKSHDDVEFVSLV